MAWSARFGLVVVTWVTAWLALGGTVQASTTAFETQAKIQELGEEGLQHLIQRRFDLAAPLFEQALELVKRLGDPVAEARFSFVSGFAHVQLDHAKGLAHLERAEMLCRNHALSMDFCEQNRIILKLTWATRGVLVEPEATVSKRSLEQRFSAGVMPLSFDDLISLAHSEDPLAWNRRILEEWVDSGAYD